MVTQHLFGEKSIVLETTSDNWAKIRLKYDGYEGWCQQGHLSEIDEKQYTKVDKDLTSDWVNDVDYNGYHMFVPMGSSLTAFKNGKAFWRKTWFILKAKFGTPRK